jgi:hypothetical protein
MMSIHELDPPRHFDAIAGWLGSNPVSIEPTTTPAPENP